MSAVDLEAEIDAISHLDFDPVCEVFEVTRLQLFSTVVEVVAPCKQPATWGVICRACGARSFSCDEHAHAGDFPSTCVLCKATGPFDQVMLAVRLGGGS